MKNKKHTAKKSESSVMEELRAIRDKISLEIMDMSFDELKEYLAKNSTIHNPSVWKTKYKQTHKPSAAAEPLAPYEKKK